MEKFTCEQAIKEVFSTKWLSANMRVKKQRYNEGKLSQKAIDEILRINGFTVIQQTLYIKQ
jgi:hypothetical protein